MRTVMTYKNIVCFEYSCPVCRGRLLSTNSSWIFKCEACGLLASSLEPRIPDEATESVIDEAGRQIGLMAVREHNNALIIEKIKQYLKPPATLLDVGSGLGFFLATASNAGFDAIGIEPDANVVERIGRTNVRHGYFPNVLRSNERFDVIVFNDVLEHIPDALSAVIAARKHLNEGGLLVLNCPDRTGVFYRVASLLNHFGISGAFNRLWQKDTPSPHRWYFKRDDLFEIGKRCGLDRVSSVKLVTLSRKGLFHRIFHLKGQSKLIGALSLIAAYVILPFLSILPADLGVAIMKKSSKE